MRREDNIIELRKNKRDENLQKKRMVHGGPSYAMEESSARTGTALQNKVGGEGHRRGEGGGVLRGWMVLPATTSGAPKMGIPQHDVTFSLPVCSNWMSCL